jgi:uncharacterized protein YegP (UPF0339 family)
VAELDDDAWIEATLDPDERQGVPAPFVDTQPRVISVAVHGVRHRELPILQGPCQGRFLALEARRRYDRRVWKFEVFKTDGGDWCWRLVQHNAVILVESSSSFPRRADAVRAAEETRAGIGAATVDVL